MINQEVNGFIFPNSIIDELLSELSHSELKCYLVVLRKTKGWNKEEDYISVSQFMKVTGLSNRSVIDACESLVERGILERRTGERNTNIYSIKTYKPVTSEKSSLVKNFPTTSEKSSPVTSEKSSHTKNTIKNNIQNKNLTDFSSSEKISDGGKKTNFVFSADDMKAAMWIGEQVKKLSPNIKNPNFENWANQIRLMRERDKRTHKDICELFQWANQDTFWRANILSPAKLREKWDQLEIKRRSSALQQRKETFAEKNARDWASPEKMAGVF
ncbi:replication protein [Actinobacillus porcinus]|uniref:replication protein n=1 Tax=Actinobacillus porcinus TaxID=51048 RepID=UPI0023F32D5D|nr:replication protein [Actinobacillus porcinus]MDD7545601.1 replication protein [Actinobacillus porcinus]MDY5847606.1 replication protein [Actinobacillus porcinus]